MNSPNIPRSRFPDVGMGSEFYNNFEIVKKIFKEADEKLNFHLSKIILEGPERKFKINPKYSTCNSNCKLFNF